VVAGRLNVVSDFEDLADSPEARPLSLACYPLGSTAAGSPIGDAAVVVRGYRMVGVDEALLENSSASALESNLNKLPQFVPHQTAREEALGDLKLYRVPERVTVSAKGLKQVAFLDQGEVTGRLLYEHACSPWNADSEARPARMLLATVNDKRHGLGMALPTGAVAVFEPSAFGEQLVAEQTIRDHAEGQDVELLLGDSSQVFALCERPGGVDADVPPARWTPVRTTLTNANPDPVTVRLGLGAPGDWQVRGLRGTRLKDGETIVEVTVPGNGRREVTWDVRPAGAV
jgi:hypothetical protein